MTHVLMDVDGILADLEEAIEDATDGCAFIMGAEEPLDWLCDSYNWWMTIPPMVSEDDLARLGGTGARFHFTISRKPSRGLPVKEQTRLWLRSVGMPDGDWDVYEVQDRAKYAADTGIALAVVAMPEHILALQNVTPTLIYDTWYNADIDGDRAMGIDEVIQRIRDVIPV